jgi:hypothetical protein
VILEAPLEKAWAALSTLAPARGTVGAYTGTARLEEADDDTHRATLRLHGRGPVGPVTATVTATLEAAGAVTRLHVGVHPPADAETIHALEATLASALTPRTGRLVAASLAANWGRR